MATARSFCQRNPSPTAVAKPLPSNRDEKMKRIEAKFQVVTPCFLGGANHEKEAELRLPSIKGALRFWWRALNYAQIANSALTPNKIIENLREKEGNLFGSSEQGKGQGQSSLIMRLNAESQNLTEIKSDKILRGKNGEKVGKGAIYLGYGVMDFKGQLTRSCLKAPFEFTLQIGAKKQEHLDEILPVLKLFGLLGGLGSKSRKGYGSLNLMKLKVNGIDDWQKPADEDEYKKQLSDLLKPARGYGEEPEISAFSSKTETRIYLTRFKSRNSAMEVLNEYGKEMVRYRSWGRNGKILDGEKSEQNFRDDHDWAKGIKWFHKFHPRRAVFGLPHNYGKGVEVKPKEHERRASPLFFHVHKIGNEYVGVALLLRSQFLPKSEKILANRKPVPANPNWKVLTDFLGRICDKTIWP